MPGPDSGLMHYALLNISQFILLHIRGSRAYSTLRFGEEPVLTHGECAKSLIRPRRFTLLLHHCFGP